MAFSLVCLPIPVHTGFLFLLCVQSYHQVRMASGVLREIRTLTKKRSQVEGRLALGTLENSNVGAYYRRIGKIKNTL